MIGNNKASMDEDTISIVNEIGRMEGMPEEK